MGVLKRKGVCCRWIAVLLLSAGVVAIVVVTHKVFTSRYPGANDFASRWGGAKAFWRDGLSPYSDEATSQIQLLIYGRPIPPEEEQEYDPGPFAYPFYTVFLLFPFVWLPYEWAEAVWLVLLEACLLLGLLVTIRLIRWRPPLWLLACTALWAFLFYPDARALVLGQFSVFVFAMIAVSLWALDSRREALAGVCLALSTVKPHMVFLLVPLLLAWAVRARLHRFVAVFAAGMILLLGVSWLVEPPWLAEFVSQVARYPSYTAIGSPLWIVAHVLVPVLGSVGEWVMVGLAVLGLGVAAWLSFRRERAGLSIWLVGLCLVVTNLVALRTATSNYVVLLLPLVLIFKALQRCTGGQWLVVPLELVLLVGMWAHFLFTLEGKFEHPAVYLPLPLGLLAVFGPGRRWLEDGSSRDEAMRSA
jgi:hypothetical protein